MNDKQNKFRQFLIFPILYIPYMIVDRKFIVNWLGCGCNRDSFNENDFTLLFWSVVGIIVTIISLFNLKKMPKLYSKIVYTIQVILGVLLLIAFCFFTIKSK